MEHTEQWALIEPLLPWHEQREYELLRPIVLFGDTPAERAGQTGAAARTLHEKARRFDEEGVPSLFPADRVRRFGRRSAGSSWTSRSSILP